MTEQDQINILLIDHNTPKEAEKRIRSNKVIIYDDPGEYIQMLKDNDCYESETVDDIRQGKIADVSIVNYNDHEYAVMYIL